MAKLQYRTISKRTVENLSVEKDSVFWDRALPGFGVRVYPSGSKVYVVQARFGGKSRRVTVGRHGVLTADRARRRAAALIARIKAGEDPVPPSADAPAEVGVTVAELAARFLVDHAAVRCKPGSIVSYRSLIKLHISPELGALPVASIERDHVAALHYRLRNKPCTANGAVGLLSYMLTLGEEWGLRPEGGNPCRFVRRYAARKRERFLSDAEFQRLGNTIEELRAEGKVSPAAAAAIRLLMLTGCRRNEILTLRWDDVDLEAGELRLRDSKTGARLVPLSPAAARVLCSLPRDGDNPWAIAGRKRGTRLTNVNTSWGVVRARAGLDDVRLHDLRHSFASRALALGESLPAIGRLLGHKRIQTTARYAHLDRSAVKAAAARVARSIGADILGVR